MSFETPTLEQFTLMIEKTLEKTTIQDLEKCYVQGTYMGSRNIFTENVLSSDGDLQTKIKKLAEVFYQFYLDASVLKFNLDYEPERHFWSFVKKSEELMKLPFFKGFFSEPKDRVCVLGEVLNRQLGPSLVHRLGTVGIAPEIFYQATSKDLRWVLGDLPGISAGEKLQIMEVHRNYH